MPINLAAIQQAFNILKPQIPPTPTVSSPWLSHAAGADVHLKLESFQPTGSFKVRGACYALSQLAQQKKLKGVITMSAGNHAQAVAYFARRIGLPATIIMPEFAPVTKIQRTEALGATVILQGETLNDAAVFARAKADAEGLELIHPYDDPAVIAGQGTVALELMESLPHLDAVVVPVGGGGLIAGMATAIKALHPRVKIYGVQSALFPTMKQALAGQKPRSGGTSLAEGISVKLPGQHTLPIVKALVEDILLVDEPALEQAVFSLLTEQKIVAEGAGAAGVAAILSHAPVFKGQHVATVICGANIDSRLLSSILMRGLAKEGHLVRLRVGIIDVPGALAKVAQIIASLGANIVEVEHHRFTPTVIAKGAALEIVAETRDHSHVQAIMERLRQAGFTAGLLLDVD